jgi:hypothetical protein
MLQEFRPLREFRGERLIFPDPALPVGSLARANVPATPDDASKTSLSFRRERQASGLPNAQVPVSGNRKLGYRAHFNGNGVIRPVEKSGFQSKAIGWKPRGSRQIGGRWSLTSRCPYHLLPKSICIRHSPQIGKPRRHNVHCRTTERSPPRPS